MGSPLAPEVRDRLSYYDAELNKRYGHGIRHFGNRYRHLRGAAACDGKTVENGMRGASIHSYSHGAIAEFIDWLEETYAWLLQTYSDRGPAHLQLALEVVLDNKDADVRFSAARLLYAQSYFRTAAHLLTGVASSYAAKREFQQQAKVLRMHASCATFVGNFQLADGLLSQAVRLSRKANDMVGEINGREEAAFNDFSQDEFARAEKAYQEIRLRAERYDPACFGSVCYGLGRVLQRSNPAVSAIWHRRGIDAFGSNDIGLANCHYGLGSAFLELKDRDQAREELEEAERLYRKWDNNVGVSECLKGLAELASRRM